MRSEAIWIILCFLLILSLSCWLWNRSAPEAFITTIPITTIPVSNSDTTAKTTVLNGYWREILQWLGENPTKAVPFIADIKEKFFSEDCGIRQPRIDFEGLSASYRPVFS